jgi:hypothetical protein
LPFFSVHRQPADIGELVPKLQQGERHETKPSNIHAADCEFTLLGGDM